MTQIDFRLHFERAPGRFLILAPDEPRYTILGASDAYLTATMTTRDIITRPLFEVFPDNPADAHADGTLKLGASLQRTLGCRTSDVMAVQRYDIRDGSGRFQERYWSPVNAPVVSNDGALVSLIHRVEDVSELIRGGEILHGDTSRLEHEIVLRSRELAAANAALLDAAAHRQRLVAMTSHDLRTPLAAIQNATHVLTHLVRLVEVPPLDILERIKSSVTRMTGMLNDLDDYVTAEVTGTLPISRERVNVRALCDAAIDEVRLAYPTRLIELDRGENIAADVDSRRFHQLLTNLVTNALTYGAQDRPVRVSLRRSYAFCVATVSNEGEPIVSEVIPVLFQPFRRGRGADDARHMGLGLFIVEQIAQAHGGGVEVRSSPEGTHFTVFLPCEGS